MLAFYNESNKPFNIIVKERNGEKEWNHNRVIINMNKNFSFNSFLRDEDKDKVKDAAKLAVNGRMVGSSIIHPRMTFNNQNQDPLLIANSKTGSSIFLIANLLLGEDEKLIDVQTSSRTYIINNRINKYENVAFTASFKLGEENHIILARVKKSDVSRVKITKFIHDGEGNFTASTTTEPRENYTYRDTNHSFTIKPYRPYRPSFLIFAHANDYEKAVNVYKDKNYHVELFNNVKELAQKIVEWKEKRFRAATIYVDKAHTERYTSTENRYMQEIRNSFNKALVVHNDKFVKIITDYNRIFQEKTDKENVKKDKPSKPKENVKKSVRVIAGDNLDDIANDIPPRFHKSKKAKCKPTK